MIIDTILIDRMWVVITWIYLLTVEFAELNLHET